MSDNDDHKEQRIGLWIAGGAAALSTLVILFYSIYGWENGQIEGSPGYGQAASAEVAASAASHPAEAVLAAPEETSVSASVAASDVMPPAASAASVAAPAAAAAGDYVVQVGAVSDQARAQQYQQRLSQQFSVPGRVMQNGAVWRIQLGPFADKAQASAVQQRLQSEAQLQSFITRAN